MQTLVFSTCSLPENLSEDSEAQLAYNLNVWKSLPESLVMHVFI